MKRQEESVSEACPVARSLEIIGDRWSLLIVRDAFDGIRRFGEYQRNLGLSKSVLASRLHALVEEGVLRVVPAENGSAYQEYELTEKGQSLFHIIVGLRQWGERFLFPHKEAHSVMLERTSGNRVGQLTLRTKGGRVLQPEDVVVKKVSNLGRGGRTT